MRNRIDKLGVAEPEIRKQGDNQIVIQLAGVTDPRRRRLIGKTAQLELYDLEQDLIGPSVGAQGPSRLGGSTTSWGQERLGSDNASSTTCSARTAGCWRGLRRRVRKRSSRGRTRACHREARCSALLATPSSCRAWPLRSRRVRRTHLRRPVLLPLPLPAERRREPDSRDDGCAPQVVGHTTRLRPVRPADRADGVHGRGENRFQDITRRLAARQPPRYHQLRDRARPRDQSWPQIDQNDRALSDGISGRRPDRRTSARSARRRTSRSCCRPELCRSPSSRSSAPTSRRRSARTRSRRRRPPRSACSSSRSS